MVGHRLLKQIDALMARLSEESYLLGTLKGIFDEVQPAELLAVQTLDLTGQAESHNHNNSARATLQRAYGRLKQISQRRLFSEIDRLEESVTTFYSQSASESGSSMAETFVERIRQFSESYEAFLKDYKLSDAMIMARNARALYAHLDSARQTLQVVRHLLLATTESPRPEEDLLSLFFDGDTTLAEAEYKAQLLHKIYSEICQFLRIRESEFPLRFVKLEIGSFWVVLLGSKKALVLLSATVTAVAGYLFRSRTTEGKLNEIPRRLEIVEQLLLHAAQQEHAGNDASEIRELAQKAGVLVTQKAVALLEKELSVEVNGKVYSTVPTSAVHISRKSPALLESHPQPPSLPEA